VTRFGAFFVLESVFMTTEVEQVQEEEITATDDKEAQAAFDASFKDEAPIAAKPAAKQEATEPEKQVTAEPAKVDEPQKQEEEAAPAKDETPSPTPAPAPAIDVTAELRKLQGQYGALNDLLRQTLKTKEAEGKPAALTSVELKRMKAEYPDMAEFLQEDLAEAIKGITQAAPPDPKVIEALVSERVQREMSGLREAAVTDVHETWKTDLFADGKRTPEYDAWLKTMPPDEAEKLEGSTSPYYVIKKLNQFYDWKTKETKAKTEKQDRLKAAITPQGVPRAGQPTLSDQEAMNRGFEEGFAS
jgi:hypothetical protein